MTTPNFSTLMESCEVTADNKVTATITENWMQGHTTYGGLSSALCLKAAHLKADQPGIAELPPLRSALINFIGPVGGNIEMQVEVLRAGKSVSNVEVNMFSDKGLATHVVFTFGACRKSRIEKNFVAFPEVPGVAESEDFFQPTVTLPQFTQQFDVKLAKGGLPASGSKQHEHFIWVRHKDKKANDLTALLGVADMPPPAVLPMFTEFSPISSMTWMINILTEDLSTEDGWWLMRTAADQAKDGYSSQHMQIWNSHGQLVTTGQQNVAIFY